MFQVPPTPHERVVAIITDEVIAIVHQASF